MLAADRFAALTRDAWWLPGITMLGQVAASVEHRGHAAVLYELLEPYAAHCVVMTTNCGGSAARTLGLLATVLERFADAERELERALATNARIRSRLWVAHTQRDYAWMLLRRDGPGDRDRAQGLAEQALAAAGELGLRAVARNARTLLRSA